MKVKTPPGGPPMPERFTSERNLAFLLYEVFDYGSDSPSSPFHEHTRGTIDLYIGFSLRFAGELLLKADNEMNMQTVILEQGKAAVHPATGLFREEFGKGGWITAPLSSGSGGLDMPLAVMAACYHVLSCASPSMTMYALLSQLTAGTLSILGRSDKLTEFMSLLASGRWQGAIAFSESEAGSSLADIQTSAVSLADGSYKISGHKVMVSCGADPSADGTIYLVLAKTAPGLTSLFAVPSKIAGRLNDVAVLSLDRMNGMNGIPFAQVTFGSHDDCTAYLVGTAGEGLRYAALLQDRLAFYCGLFSGALAQRAFWKAWDYAAIRRQGRAPACEKDRPVEITAHPAVKRRLLSARTASDGILALCLAASDFRDRARQSPDDTARYTGIAGILEFISGTPSVTRAGQAVESAAAATGSYACLKETPFGTMRRDMEGLAVHPRTPDVAASGFMIQKIFPDRGKNLFALLDEMRNTADCCLDNPQLIKMSSALLSSAGTAGQVTEFMLELHGQEQDALVLQDASLYADILWLGACAWLWLRQAAVAHDALEQRPNGRYARFYEGRIASARYFFEYELPALEALSKTIMSGQGVPFLFFPEQYRL